MTVDRDALKNIKQIIHFNQMFSPSGNKSGCLIFIKSILKEVCLAFVDVRLIQIMLVSK